MSTTTGFRYHTETIDGVEIEKPFPKRLHAIIQARIQRMLARQLEGTDLEILPSLDLLCGRDRYVPDLVVAAKNAQYTDDMLDGASSLAVEIMSPGQTIGRLFEKCDVYVRHGTSTCWVVWPKRRKAWVYTKSEMTEVFEGTGALQAVTGNVSLSIGLADLFRDLPETQE